MLSSEELLDELNQNGRYVSKVFNDSNTILEWLDLINWVLNDRTSSQISCKCCLKGLREKEIIGIRTKHGLIRELLADWNIDVSEAEINSQTILTAFKCERCGTVSFSGEQGNEGFYDACYRSPSYSRTVTWDYSLIIDELNAETNLKVLDFGGGISALTKLIGSETRVNVVDLSALVRAQLENMNIACYPNLSSLPIGEKFDFIMFSHTIEHLDEPIKLLKSLISLLKQGGKIAVTTPNSENIDLLNSPLAWPPHHTVAFKSSALYELMLELGLKDIKVFWNPEIQKSEFDFMIVGVK
jgi:2-polyprenyl-3-methyl-5-hydroxy-6-metoxy-1,4-benzoquinol methylase